MNRERGRVYMPRFFLRRAVIHARGREQLQLRCGGGAMGFHRVVLK